MDDDAAVVDPVALLQRSAHDDHRTQVGGGLGDPGEGVVDRVEQRVLQEQVVDGVAREAQLGEDRERHAVVVEVAQLGDDRVGVALGVDRDDRQRARGDTGETLGPRAVEVHGHSQSHGHV